MSPEVRESGSPEVLDAVRRGLALAKAAPGSRAYVVVRETVDLPNDPLGLFATASTQRTLLWDDHGWLLATGVTASIATDGPGRSCALSALQARVTALTAVTKDATPIFLTAWSFEDTPPGPSHWSTHLPGAQLWLPERLWWQRDGHSFFIRATAVTANDTSDDVVARLESPSTSRATPMPSSWPVLTNNYRDTVEDAVALIRDGALKKVVLARACDETLSSACDPATLLATLHDSNHDATVYAHDLDDGSVFVGATPEVLFEAHRTTLKTMALAGSTPRTADDEQQITTMLDSTKQRKEHGLVVEHLVHVLRPRCAPFAVPNAPHPRRLSKLIHLETLIEATLHRPDYLELIGALHPTPAVCGLPTAAAAHYLARREKLHRGLYSGVLGWLSADAARCVVPLRGGIINGSRARLFAGAGIVETSDPDDELAETELKLGVMRRALKC